MKNVTTINAFEKFVDRDVRDFLPKSDALVKEVKVRFSSLSSLVSTVPTDFFCGGGMGKREKIFFFTAVLENGELLESPSPEYTRESTRAHSSRIAEPGISLGEAWGSDLNKIKYIVEYHSYYCEWDGGSDNCDEEYIILHIIRKDDEEKISKIRRRVEDALRKCGDPMVVLRFGAMLGVKFD